MPCVNIPQLQETGSAVDKLDPSLLTGLPPFRQLTQDEIREILHLAQPHRYDEGEAVFLEGAEATRFFLLLDGVISVIRTSSTGEQVIALHIAPGQLFGIAPALQRDSYPAMAVAAAESLVLSWRAELWNGFAKKYAGFATENYRIVGERLGEMQSRIVSLATKAVEQRVAAVLLRMANQTGRKVEDGIEITFPVTRQNISEMTGTTLHTVSRLLSAWERDGLVHSTRRHIVVTAPHKLVVLSNEAG